LLKNNNHKGVQNLVRDLNKLYRETPALYELDCEGCGFEWVEGNDFENSCLTFIRHGKRSEEALVVACNFTPVPRYNYRIGVNQSGIYEEVFNSDAFIYGGSGVCNTGDIQTEEPGWNFKEYALQVVLPPLSVVCFRLKKEGPSRRRDMPF
jgi:1,4-alpha-glucan branching enzyme